jgi:hypothetical protein
MASSSHGTQRDTITGFLSYAVLENEARGRPYGSAGTRHAWSRGQRDIRTNKQILVDTRSDSFSSNQQLLIQKPASNVQQDHHQKRGLRSRLHNRDRSLYGTLVGTVQEDARQSPHQLQVDLRGMPCSIETSSGEYE